MWQRLRWWLIRKLMGDERWNKMKRIEKEYWFGLRTGGHHD